MSDHGLLLHQLSLHFQVKFNRKVTLNFAISALVPESQTMFSQCRGSKWCSISSPGMLNKSDSIWFIQVQQNKIFLEELDVKQSVVVCRQAMGNASWSVLDEYLSASLCLTRICGEQQQTNSFLNNCFVSWLPIDKHGRKTSGRFIIVLENGNPSNAFSQKEKRTMGS